MDRYYEHFSESNVFGVRNYPNRMYYFEKFCFAKTELLLVDHLFIVST